MGDAVGEVARRIDPDIGRFGGKAGIAEFTELRWITMQTMPRHYPFQGR